MILLFRPIVAFALSLILLVSFSASAMAGLAVGTTTAKSPLRGVSAVENFSIGVDELRSGQLSRERMQDLGLDLSAFSQPLTSYELDYIRLSLSTTATDVSQWQADINGLGAQQAAQWQLLRFSNGVDDITEMTHAMIDAAVGNSYSSQDIIAARNETLATIQTFWTTASLDPSSPSSIRSFLATNTLLSSVAFASDDEADAYIAHADRSQFTLPVFRSCYDSGDSLTGGAGRCLIRHNDWNSLQSLQMAAADDNTTAITKTQLDAVFTADNATYTIDLTESTNLHYVQNCITSLNVNSWANMKSCVSDAVPKVAAKWKIYQISLGYDNTTHPTSDLTVSLYDRAVSDSGSPFLQEILDAKPSYTMATLRKNIGDYFSAQRVTDQSSDDSFKLFPVNRAGFKDGLNSYNAWQANSGFSVATVQSIAAEEDIVRVWEACRRSHDSVSGGYYRCTTSYGAWSARATTQAANNIVQVRHNDFSGPRVYFETLMGVQVNLQDFAKEHSTRFRWYDENRAVNQESRIGWISSSGSYGFLNIEATSSPPIGVSIQKL